MNAKGESSGHKRLKTRIKKVMDNCKFVSDKELHFNISGRKDETGNWTDDFSIDVLAKFRQKGRNCMIFFECKDVKSLKSLKMRLSSWQNYFKQILNRVQKIRIINSHKKKINEIDFDDVDEIRLCYVFGEKKDEIDNETLDIFKDFSSFVLDSKDLKYYEKVSSTLEELTKYELFREFNFNFETTSTIVEKAVEIQQPNFPKMYLFGLHPGKLIEICYVLRRTSNKPMAYQRFINKDRIKNISDFLSSASALIPNAIIIAFDADEKIQKKIKFEDGLLSFPHDYCIAWIIDGQHRVYGFQYTKYKNWSNETSEDFKLPIVAFKNLNEINQNRTFVNINYNQKKINPTLLCQLASVTKDLNNELTWPSLLVTDLCQILPLKDKVKISEFDTGRKISISGFVKQGLLESLLGYNNKKKIYNGPLYKYAPFNTNFEFDNENNKKSFERQFELLKRYFEAIYLNTTNQNEDKDPWLKIKDYSLLKVTGINALLLVLARILEKYPKVNFDLNAYLKPLSKINFEKEYVYSKGGGWKGFREFANEIVNRINTDNKDDLRLYGEKEKQIIFIYTKYSIKEKTLVDELIDTFKALGNKPAHYSEIYDYIEMYCSKAKARNQQVILRARIEEHSIGF